MALPLCLRHEAQLEDHYNNRRHLEVLYPKIRGEAPQRNHHVLDMS